MASCTVMVLRFEGKPGRTAEGAPEVGTPEDLETKSQWGGDDESRHPS